MADELNPLPHWADGLLQQLSPAARRQLARDIARRLRSSQQARIAAQQNPDGSPYTPRLRQKSGHIRRQMFAKLRTARFLKMEASSNAAIVGFLARVDRIAAVHQYGLRDRVRPGGPTVQYARRQLLGYTPADVDLIADQILHHLAP